jgi:ATP-binding cassette subfamily B multidrug efflux pump
LKLLLGFFRRFLSHKRNVVGGFVAVPLGRLTDIAVTLLIGQALNSVQAGEGVDALQGYLAWIALYAVAQGIFSFFQRWLIVSTSRRVEAGLKQELFDKLTTLSTDFHDRNRSGDIISRLTSDVEAVRMFLGPGLMFAAGSLVMLPVTLVLLVRLDAKLALTMALPLVLMGAGFRWLTPRLHVASKAVQEGLADLSHRAQENFGGIRVVKGFAREAHESERFAQASRANRDHQIHLANWRGIAHVFATSSSQVTMVVILFLGGMGMIDGRLGYGDTLVFIDLTLKLFWPIIAIGWLAGMYPRAKASAERLREILDEDPSIRDDNKAQDLRAQPGDFCLRDVSFRYPNAQTDALAGINLQLPAGHTLGVVGPTGCGKTTLLQLFGRMLDPAGEILHGGIPLRDLKLTQLRSNLGFVPQDSFLFSDTWSNNVAFGVQQDLGEERLQELARIVCMEAELAQFNGGLAQLIGERGVTLSGGQRQRTCIARALACNPPVLILDDALSAVDTGTETQLLTQLRAAGEQRTVIIAAHRLSSVRHADEILVLDSSGRPAAQGKHAALLRQDGWYAQTWTRQQAREEARGA